MLPISSYVMATMNNTPLRKLYSNLRFFAIASCLMVGQLLFAQSPFITTWKTDNPGWTTSNQIRIPGTGVNYNISWEEAGNLENKGSKKGFGITTITFPYPGTYIVSISPGAGTFTSIKFENKYDSKKILAVNQWGDIPWSTMELAFFGCENIDCVATDLPDLSDVTSMTFMFKNCKNLKGPLNIGEWNTQNVTHMTSMFADAILFNQAIGNWDTRNVKSMYLMFDGAKSFNQNIENWNVSKVQTMLGMFWNADSFNQNIGNWDTRNVSEMTYMFAYADNFNQDISAWNTTLVYSMSGMFAWAIAFNQDISTWQLEQNVFMDSMFDYSGMDCNNYSATIKGWGKNPATPENRKLGAIGLGYGTDALELRNHLINNKGWTITGDSLINADCLKPSTINHPDDSKTIHLWPNPALDYLYLDLPQESLLKVYDLIGKRHFITQIPSGESRIPLQHLAPGMYIFHFEQGGRHLVVVE